MVAFFWLAVAGWAQESRLIPDRHPDERVDRILTRLETREVRDLTAKVEWRLDYVGEDDPTVKLGQIWYMNADPVPKFLAHFRQSRLGNRLNEIDERHMFDGEWYVELQSATRTLTRRLIRRPDEEINPYRLGEGPFPVPFGQKKSDILREFEVAIVEPGDGKSAAPSNTHHLRLTPREDSQTGRTYKRVDLWIGTPEHEYSGLPVKVRASKLDPSGQVNSHITVTFSEARLNQGFSSNTFELRKPPGYEEIVE